MTIELIRAELISAFFVFENRLCEKYGIISAQDLCVS